MGEKTDTTITKCTLAQIKKRYRVHLGVTWQRLYEGVAEEFLHVPHLLFAARTTPSNLSMWLVSRKQFQWPTGIYGGLDAAKLIVRMCRPYISVRCQSSLLQVMTRWTRPEPHHIKLNVDASFHADGCEGVTGALLRDYKGRFIAAATKCLPNIAINYGDSSERGIRTLWRKVILQKWLICAKGNESAAIMVDCVDLVSSIGTMWFLISAQGKQIKLLMS
jgi:hypothetical protein